MINMADVKITEDIPREIETLVEYEGYSVQEAKLTYAARKDLPASAFCGPDRSYPAQDAAHVRNGLARLGTFGGKLPPAVRDRIHACLLRRAKRFGVEVSEKKVEETVPTHDFKKTLEFLDKEFGMCSNCE